ncbi:glycosyltransferase family 2 protein [Brevibacillus composti]|uniref:Glucosyl-3-phosphoglycerate synthase n=1 Tax=Brevibacillus composti TaxID=2796470 RepID=A0A7T5EHX9_9BACL|nr:glycosyltransferase family 2 protein [Brevibacillus composti]QQE72867.1 glycosyltransferase family 2 protein [Brevibacillus composti]QUO39945.1 glycosyltransferase family 2 protein [Brevibacillus composti]
MKKVSVIIPAYNEADWIVPTLQAVRERLVCDELIVVDDGSSDQTAALAAKYADQVLQHPVNRGKGEALQTGWRHSSGEVLLFLDGDLRESAGLADALLSPVLNEAYDMAIAVLPPPPRKVGLGLAKGLAKQGIRALTGFAPEAPLSGQRALTRKLLERIGRLEPDFGIEVGLTIEALRAGGRLIEVPVPFTHRHTGNDLSGYRHRGKELLAIGRALGRKWWEGAQWNRN